MQDSCALLVQWPVDMCSYCVCVCLQDANEVLVDALPYLDKELDDAAMRKRVERYVRSAIAVQLLRLNWHIMYLPEQVRTDVHA